MAEVDRTYLKENNVAAIYEDMTAALLREKPSDVKAFLHQYLSGGNTAASDNTNDSAFGDVTDIAFGANGEIMIAHRPDTISVLDATTFEVIAKHEGVNLCLLNHTNADGTTVGLIAKEAEQEDGSDAAFAYDALMKDVVMALPALRNSTWAVDSSTVTGGQLYWNSNKKDAIEEYAPAAENQIVGQKLSQNTWVRQIEVFSAEDGSFAGASAAFSQGPMTRFTDSGLFGEATAKGFRDALGETNDAVDEPTGTVFKVAMPTMENVMAIEGDAADAEQDIYEGMEVATRPEAEREAADDAGETISTTGEITLANGDVVKADGRTLSCNGEHSWIRDDLMVNQSTRTFTGLLALSSGGKIAVFSGVPSRMCVNVLNTDTGRTIARVRHFPLRAITNANGAYRAILAGPLDRVKVLSIDGTPVTKAVYEGFGDHQFQPSATGSHYLMKADKGFITLRSGKDLSIYGFLDDAERLYAIHEPLLVTRTPDFEKINVYRFWNATKVGTFACPTTEDESPAESVRVFGSKPNQIAVAQLEGDAGLRISNATERIFSFDEPISSYAVTANGTRLAILDGSSKVHLYDIADGKVTKARSL